MRVRASMLSQRILHPICRIACPKRTATCKSSASHVFSASASGDTYQQASAPQEKSDIQVAASETRVMSYNQEHYNKVLLTGVACEDPKAHTSRQGKTYVTLTIGQPYPKKAWVQRINLTFWESSAESVMRDVTKGSQMAVSGCLSEWNDRVSLHVEDFYLVETTTSPFTPDLVRNILEKSQRDADGEGNTNALPVTKSKAQCHNLYTKHNMSAKDVAQQRNIKETTVIGYLAEVAVAGLTVDWARLCKEAEIGPVGSVFMTADEIHAGIMEVVGDVGAVDTGTFKNATIGKIRGRVQGKSRVKFNIQEELKPGFIYAQIKVVLAMLLSGIGPKDWNAFLLPPDEPQPAPF
ncbi:hypothetical protein BSKO_01336 [Bryopsis sp. KO-2023]|nr:hypothetical protein BSKO_01336 [Bryopsis sp. KO-2023]